MGGIKIRENREKKDFFIYFKSYSLLKLFSLKAIGGSQPPCRRGLRGRTMTFTSEITYEL